MAAKKMETAARDEKQGLMLRLPKSLHTALRHVSIDRGVSLNTLLTEVLEAWWAKQPERTKYRSGEQK
ncbi:MAG: toxin-antitoxin system HicB family antitoxin [Gammaproteobacteria bacterium]